MVRILSFLQRGYWLHLLLAAVIVAEFAAARLAHKTDADIDALIQSGDAREKAYALHVKSNRGEPRFTRRDVLPMLRADERLVRELMMTTNMMRFRIERIRRREIARWEDRIARDRANFLLDHRIRKVSAMTLAELEAFLDTTADDP